MTNEEQAAVIAALVEERDAAAAAGKEERVAAIEANLALLGAGGKPKAKRAEKRTEVPAPDEEKR